MISDIIMFIAKTFAFCFACMQEIDEHHEVVVHQKDAQLEQLQVQCNCSYRISPKNSA